VVRLALGRERPSRLEFEPHDQLALPSQSQSQSQSQLHVLRVVSLGPLRFWAIDLRSRRLEVRSGAGEELVVDGAHLSARAPPPLPPKKPAAARPSLLPDQSCLPRGLFGWSHRRECQRAETMFQSAPPRIQRLRE
jgi:hypothetical protein